MREGEDDRILMTVRVDQTLVRLFEKAQVQITASWRMSALRLG